MVSFWQSSQKDDDETQNHGQDQSEGSQGNERSHLLPRPPQEGYLSPDDPAVSPYNLWSVRFLRYFTILASILTFLWLVLLLVSIFVSPPGMHSRGSGFFDFSYTALTMGLLLTLLLFFSTPSKAAQVTCLVVAVILLIDTIIIVAVPKIRLEEGWVGIASVLWALLISIWTIVTDRIVTWGKHEEEERLTGRHETRRTLTEWLSVLLSTIILVIIGIITVLLTGTLILRARDASLAPPGERYFVDGDKYQIHLYCEGSQTDVHGIKTPTVLFEAGEGAFAGSMITIATSALSNGSISRYCYSDRPGFGWSDNAPSPFSAGMGADRLSEAMAQAGEEGPWVLVSAGVGSIYSRIWSSRHNGDIHGLLLIDPLHEDLLHELAAPHKGFLLWAWGILSPMGLDRLPAALFRGRTREDRVYGRSAYQNGKYIKAKLQESLVADSFTKSEVSTARNTQQKDTPLVLISSGINVKKDAQWEKKQRDLSHLTDNLVNWDIVNKAPTEVWTTYDGRQVIEKRLKKLVYG